MQTESIEARATLGLPPIIASFPLIQRGFEPQDADLKLGPVFFKLKALSAGLLASDNINRTENNREAGTIGILTISGAVIAQLTEGLRLALSGSFVYLPFTNEAGIAGFGLYAPFVLGFDSQPIVRSEVTWNTVIGGWNVVFADDFQIGVGRYSNNVRDTAILFTGGEFDEYDRAGRYSFGGLRNGVPERNQAYNNESNQDFIYFSNIVSAQVDRLVVGKTRLRVQASHENLWYNQGNRGLPQLRDQVTVSLVSERENLRFKPFVIYQALKTDLQGSFQQSVRAGLDGPITEQLAFHGEVGWFFGENRDSAIWLVSLRHQAGPYTEQSVFYGRTVNSFYDQLSDRAGYNIRQILGPKVVANAFVMRSNVTDLIDDRFSYSEYSTGLRFAIAAGPRTSIILTGTYAWQEADGRNTETLTGVASLTRYFSDTLSGRLVYQYQRYNSDFFNDNYYENLVYLSITKDFN